MTHSPEYRRALMDVADYISGVRSASERHAENFQFARSDVTLCDIILERLVAMMKSPPAPPFKYSPIPAIEADLRRRIDDE